MTKTYKNRQVLPSEAIRASYWKLNENSSELDKDLDDLYLLAANETASREQVVSEEVAARQAGDASLQTKLTEILNETALNPNKDPEVTNARGGFPTVGSRLDNSDTKLNDVIFEVGKPEYSAPVTTYANVISLPSDVAKGQVSEIVKGVTRENLVKSSNMDKDSNADGVVDDFIVNIGTSLTVVKSLDAVKKAQKIEITASTDIASAQVRPDQSTWFNVVPGEKISLSIEYEMQGTNCRCGLGIRWADSVGTTISYGSGVYATSNGKGVIKNENLTVPANASKGDVYIYYATTAVGGTGSFWFKNLLAERAASVGSYISSGIKSTFCSLRGTSVGKNLFDKNNVTYGYYLDNNTGLPVVQILYTYSSRIKVAPSTSYKVSGTLNVLFYDYNGKRIGFSDSSLFTTPNNIDYVKVSVAIDKLDTCQIEKNTVATSYEPHVQSNQYFIAKDDDGNIEELRSVPSAKDSLTDGVLSKMVCDDYIVKSTDIASVTTLTNVVIAQTATPFKADIWTLAGTPSIGTIRVQDKDEVLLADRDNVNNVGKFYRTNTGRIDFIFAFGTTLEQARTALTGASLNYQLAQPIITPTKVEGSLQAYPNGTIYWENVVKEDPQLYTDALYVTDVALPIKNLLSVKKVVNNIETDVALSTCTISPDRTKFTSTAIAANDSCIFEYEYDSSLTTNPEITYSYPINLSASVKSLNEETVRLNDYIFDLNDFTIAMLLNHEMRISLLEAL